VYDGEDILRETSSAGPVLTYLHGPGIDEPFASEDAGGVRTDLHPDGLGSIVKTTNASGAAGSTFKYNAFGVIETGTPSPYAYTGREWDSEAGLYYYRARYYDPKIGRFISEDPSQIWSWPNLYAYVENNPVNYTDPLGLLKVKGGVALPTGPLLINLRCLEECLGREVELRISETTGEHAPGNPHTRGVAADFTVVPRDPFINPTPRNPAAISVPVPNMDVLCCARACSFAFTQYETQGTPGATAAHFHAQIPKGQGGAVQPTQTQCCGR
jgi:RHS repeat-associated protein